MARQICRAIKFVLCFLYSPDPASDSLEPEALFSSEMDLHAAVLRVLYLVSVD